MIGNKKEGAHASSFLICDKAFSYLYMAFVPASKVFTTWEAHSDGKLQVGLRACTGSGVLGTAPNLPLASNEETGSLRGRGASHWIVASEPGEAPTPAFPLLCLFECDSIRGRLPEIHENPLYY